MPSDTDAEYVICDGDWKLLADKNHKPIELFNQAEDPLEFFNLLGEKAGIVERLHRLMLDKIKSIEKNPLRPVQLSKDHSSGKH